MPKESVAPQALIPLYTEMARCKLMVKWAEMSIAAAQRAVIENKVIRFPVGAEKASVTDPLTGRRITARKVQRKKYTDVMKKPAAELSLRFPEVAAEVTTEKAVDARYSTAFYSSRAWTAQFPGVLTPLAVPGFRADAPWAVHDFVMHGRVFIKKHEIEHEGLQQMVVAALPEMVNLAQLQRENIKHVFGDGLAYHVRYTPAGLQQRVNWVTLQELRPDIFQQFKKLEAVKEEVAIGFTMATDSLDWDSGDDDSEADSRGWGLD